MLGNDAGVVFVGFRDASGEDLVRFARGSSGIGEAEVDHLGFAGSDGQVIVGGGFGAFARGIDGVRAVTHDVVVDAIFAVSCSTIPVVEAATICLIIGDQEIRGVFGEQP